MRRTVLTLASAVFLTAGALAADSANLGPTFAQGAKTRYELHNKSAQVINAPQGEITMEVENTLVLSCEVTDATDAGATVKATITSIKTLMQSPMFSDGFDSDKPAEQDAASQLGQFLRPMIGKSFTVVFDAEGANADIRGIDTLFPANLPQASQMIAQAINARGLGTAVVGFYVLKDGHEMIPAGEKWTDTQTEATPPLGSITITTNSSFESIENEIAKIVVDGNAVFVPDPAMTQASSMGIDESSIDGAVLWDTGNDMLKSAESNTVLVISMANPATPGIKQTIRVSNESKTTRLD